MLDLYSRFIVDSVSQDMLTSSTSIPALKMARKARIGLIQFIVHSDGGGQYYCKEGWTSFTIQDKKQHE